MKKRDNNTEAFLALLRAGLWEKEVLLSMFGEIDFEEIYRLSEQQSVTGLVAAGLEHVSDVKVPQSVALSFAGATLQIEQRNLAMNSFVESLYGQMQKNGLYSILVKGQGIAQCYYRPLWRSAGDVDLLLNGDSYDNVKEWFKTIGQLTEEEENAYKKRLNLKVDSWDVELHGTMRGELFRRLDSVIDGVQKDIFYGGNVRSWSNGKTTVFLPSPDNDVIFVFAHILQHFFRGGIGLRQICDWCRLLWTYRELMNYKLLESRLRKMGVMTEWRTFAALAVDTLGMPVEAMPLYSPSKKWVRKSKKVLCFIFETGNFGHNRDESYKITSSFQKRMLISLSRRTRDFIKQARVFPANACRAYWGVWKTGFGVVKHHIK